VVPQERLGEAAGLKTLMDMGGLVIASLVMGQTLKPGETRPVLSIAIVMAVVLVSTAITVLFIREAVPDRHKRTARLSRRLRETFNIDFRANTAYWWLIGSRFAFLLGVTGIQAFAQYYISDVFPSENPIALTGNLLAALTVTLILFAVAGGWLGDRYGHKRILYLSSVLSAAGCLLLLAAKTPLLLVLFGSVLGGGVGLFLTSNWTLSNRLAPQKEAGKYLGFTNLATAGSSGIARLFGPAIDILNNLRPGAMLGWIFLFVVGAVFVSASALLLLKVDIRQGTAEGQQISRKQPQS
jgi:MFS family permease